MEYLDFFKELAKALFKAFGTAVTDYPVILALTIGAVGYYLQTNTHVTFYEPSSSGGFGTIKKRYSMAEIFWLFLGFIVTVIVANVLGYIFAAVAGVLSTIGGTSKSLMAPFAVHPIEYTCFLLAFLVIGGLILLARASWNYQRVNVFLAIAAAYASIFLTYVSTTLFIAIRG